MSNMTNFAALTNEQKTAWSLSFWKQARNLSFLNKFLGKDANSMVQHITELKATEKGARAVITLLTDMEGDGVVGDSNLEGNEEGLKSQDRVITIDQMRNANRHEGRMADQKSIVNFRQNSRDKLAYWLADRMDQLAFLTLAGKSYAFRTDGRTRIGSRLPNLEFAKDVVAPSAKRVGRWNGTSKTFVVGAGSNAVEVTDTPSWELFVQLKAYAKENFMRGIMEGGEETYHAFLSPMAMAKLKLDPTYLQNLRHAQAKGVNEKLFSGSTSRSTASTCTSSVMCRTRAWLLQAPSLATWVPSTAVKSSSAVRKLWLWQTSATRSGSRKSSTTTTSRVSRLPRRWAS